MTSKARQQELSEASAKRYAGPSGDRRKGTGVRA